jgi:hypothetical protein
MFAVLEPAAHAETATATRTETATIPEGLRSRVRAEGEDQLEPHRMALDLPALIIDLAFVPFLPFIVLDQRYALGRRLYDLFTNDDRTLALIPFIDPFYTRGSGLGFGGALLYAPRGFAPHATVIGVVRTNGDYRLLGEMAHPIAGRAWWLSLYGNHEVDSDRRYYGTGSATRKEDLRHFSDESMAAAAELSWVEPTEGQLRLATAARVRRHGYQPGEDPDERSLQSDGSPLPPPAFGRTTHYGEGELSFTFDTRDRTGQPTRGILLDVGATFSRAFDAPLSGYRAEAEVFAHFPVLEPDRVLVLSLGTAMAAPLGGGHEVPFPLYTSLGGSDRLRGYPTDRFSGRYAWWSSLEYRYPIYHSSFSNMTFSAALFGEIGQAGDRWPELIDRPLPFSIGAGVRLETLHRLLARFEVAGSPEGVRLNAAIGGLR